MREGSTISYDTDGPVTVVTIERPAARNAVNRRRRRRTRSWSGSHILWGGNSAPRFTEYCAATPRLGNRRKASNL